MMIATHNLVKMATHADQCGAELSLTRLGIKITMHKGDSYSRRIVTYEDLAATFFPEDLVAHHIAQLEEDPTS